MSAHAIADAFRLLLPPGVVTELRILNTPRGTVSGYFDNIDKLAAAAARWSGKAAGVYCTLNPVNPALLARATNRLVEYAKHTTSDTDIVQRRWLPLDFDPARPAGISSTDIEHAAALQRAREVVAWLRARGVTATIRADSGNGAHVLIRVELPNDADSTALVKRCIEAVALRFSDDVVAVDLGVSNAARIWKTYSTRACKGDATPDRPHRLARILEVAEDLTPTPRELLETLAALVPKEPKAEPRQNGGAHTVPPGPIFNGTAHYTFVSWAGTMHARGMSPGAILAALLYENRTRCDPIRPEVNIRKIVADITTRYVPGNVPPAWQIVAHQQHNAEEDEAVARAVLSRALGRGEQ